MDAPAASVRRRVARRRGPAGWAAQAPATSRPLVHSSTRHERPGARRSRITRETNGASARHNHRRHGPDWRAPRERGADTHTRVAQRYAHRLGSAREGRSAALRRPGSREYAHCTLCVLLLMRSRCSTRWSTRCSVDVGSRWRASERRYRICRICWVCWIGDECGPTRRRRIPTTAQRYATTLRELARPPHPVARLRAYPLVGQSGGHGAERAMRLVPGAGVTAGRRARMNRERTIIRPKAVPFIRMMAYPRSTALRRHSGVARGWSAGRDDAAPA